jgi:biopolymer transport protein ExbD
MAINIAQDGDDELISTINTTPLVDVMLVLLIIFLITIPVVTHTVPVKLPAERNQPTQTKPQNINISVDAQGNIYWNQLPVSGVPELQKKLLAVAPEVPQPEVHIFGDQNAHYQAIGEVLMASERAGIVKVGFILQPPVQGGD